MSDEETCLTDGSPVTPDHKEIDPKTGLQKGYVVLTPEERVKGYVRQLRYSYKHVGKQPKYPLRDLTDEEKERYNLNDSGNPFVKYEQYPKSELPKTGRFWTQAELDSRGCNSLTVIHLAIAETYARNPHFYDSTFCCACGKHFPLDEFVWTGTDERVGS